MRSIPFLDDRFSVRTLYTDNVDWQSHDDWQLTESRNAVLKKYVNVPVERVVYAFEVGSSDVLAVTENNIEELASVKKEDIPGRFGTFDAMVTALPGTMLCICTADCLPLFLYEPEKNLAAIAHCGWTGISGGVVSNTIAVMVERYGADPKCVVAAIGPGICERCYEVGGELKDAFAERFSPDEVECLFMPRQDGKFLLNLRKAVMLELQHVGVRSEAIHDTGICTYEAELYPSCRRVGRHIPPKQQTVSGIVLA